MDLQRKYWGRIKVVNNVTIIEENVLINYDIKFQIISM
jgi:hypothetical protein